MSPSVNRSSYWSRLASRYAVLGSPLRPHEEDVRLMEDAVNNWSALHPEPSPRALLLGSTPALALMRWPAGTTLIGVDSSYDAISAIWPGDRAGSRFGICAGWNDLPLPLSSFHIAIGDGSLNCLRYPGEARAVSRSVRSALSDSGIFVLRCYVRPELPESPEQVFDEALRGTIPTFSQFKFRLLLAMADDTRLGVPVDKVYRTWASYSIDTGRLAALTGWPAQEIESMEAYRGSATVHTFPTLTEFRSILQECFDEVSSTTLPYPLGENCRIFVLRPRGGASW